MIKIEDEEAIQEYYDLRQVLKDKGSDFQAVITHPTYALPFLNPGRLVEIKHEGKDFGWGIVVAYNKIVNQRGRPPIFTDADPPQKQYVLDVLIKTASDVPVPKDRSATGLKPPSKGDDGQVVVISVLLSTVQSISQYRVNLPRDLRPEAERKTAYRAIGEIQRRMGDIALLDPIKNMGIQDKSFRDLVKVRGSAVRQADKKQIAFLESKVDSLPITVSPDLAQLYESYAAKQQMNETIRSLKRRIDSVHDILQLEELKSRKRVLRRLGFTTSDDVVEMKGRVACEISTGDELMLTEMMFGGVFNDLEPAQATAILSCFVFDEKVCRDRDGCPHISHRLKCGSRTISQRHCAFYKKPLVESLKCRPKVGSVWSRMNTSRASRSR